MDVPTNQNDQTESVLAELHSSTAKIAYTELQRFFAQGKLLYLARGLDLIVVAKQIADDCSSEIAKLIDNQSLSIPSDAMAKQWLEQDQILWCVVVAPYVLVQELEAS